MKTMTRSPQTSNTRRPSQTIIDKSRHLLSFSHSLSTPAFARFAPLPVYPVRSWILTEGSRDFSQPINNSHPPLSAPPKPHFPACLLATFPSIKPPGPVVMARMQLVDFCLHENRST